MSFFVEQLEQLMEMHQKENAVMSERLKQQEDVSRQAMEELRIQHQAQLDQVGASVWNNMRRQPVLRNHSN